MILSINTSNMEKVLVALEDQGKVVDSIENFNKFGSQVILPAIFEICQRNDINPKEIKEITLDTGPGPFTGLKVGAAVANALAFSLEIPINGKELELDLRYT